MIYKKIEVKDNVFYLEFADQNDEFRAIVIQDEQEYFSINASEKLKDALKNWKFSILYELFDEHLDFSLKNKAKITTITKTQFKSACYNYFKNEFPKNIEFDDVPY